MCVGLYEYCRNPVSFRARNIYRSIAIIIFVFTNLKDKNKTPIVSRVLFTVKHSHKLFLTFMSVLGKPGLKFTNFPFQSRFDNVFLSKITIEVRFFKILRHIFYFF